MPARKVLGDRQVVLRVVWGEKVSAYSTGDREFKPPGEPGVQGATISESPQRMLFGFSTSRVSTYKGSVELHLSSSDFIHCFASDNLQISFS